MINSQCKIDKSEVLRYLGYRNQLIDKNTDNRIDEMIQLCLKIARPKYIYAYFGIERDKGVIHLSGTNIDFLGHDIFSHLNGANSLVLMAATLGHDCERMMSVLENRSVADAVCFNAACTALIEEVSDKCQREVAASYKSEGYYVNGRYSPGYGDFPLSQQKDLLSLLNAEIYLGITLTPGNLMLPQKSVTSVFGLFNQYKAKEVSCLSCTMKDFCQYRKVGNHCG